MGWVCYFYLSFQAICFDIFLLGFGSGVFRARRSGVGERFPCITQRYNSGGLVLLSFPAGTLHLGGFWAGAILDMGVGPGKAQIDGPGFWLRDSGWDGMEFGVGTQHTTDGAVSAMAPPLFFFFGLGWDLMIMFTIGFLLYDGSCCNTGSGQLAEQSSSLLGVAPHTHGGQLYRDWQSSN